MASPGQKWVAFGYLMAGFDKHAHCQRCRDKSKGSDSFVNNETCPHCNILPTEQKLQLSTPSYQKKKEKCEQKSDKSDKPTRSKKTEDDSSPRVDPSYISFIGVASADKKAVKSPERAGIKDEKKHPTPVKKSSTDTKLKTRNGLNISIN